jgi:hypothetical protein
MPTFNPNTYAGEVLRMITTRAFTGNEIVAGGHAFVRDGIKHKLVMPTGNVGTVIRARQATPTPNSTLSFGERYLQPDDYMVYEEFNPRAFEHHWFQDMLEGTALFRQVSPELQMAIVDMVLKKHDEELNVQLWTGDKTGGDQFDGFITKAKADTDVELVASPVALSKGNILEKLEATHAQIPKTIRKRRSLKIFGSIETEDFYRGALQDLDYKSISYEAATPTRFNGIEMVFLSGFPDDTLLACVADNTMDSNLWIGVDGASDWNDIMVNQLQNNSELWFFKMLAKVDTQFRVPQEVVLYAI